MVFVLILAVLGVVAQIAAPRILAQATNDIFDGATSRRIDAAQVAMGCRRWMDQGTGGRATGGGWGDRPGRYAGRHGPAARPGDRLRGGRDGSSSSYLPST